MRRPLTGFALLLAIAATGVQQASTAGNTLPSSTAVYRSTTVTGATPVSMDYAITGNQITGLSTTLRGTGLLNVAVRAQFAGDASVLCTRLSLRVLDLLTNLGEGTYSCPGLLEPADRPAALRITVS